MAIRKFSDITNETATKYDRFKETQVQAIVTGKQKFLSSLM